MASPFIYTDLTVIRMNFLQTSITNHPMYGKKSPILCIPLKLSVHLSANCRWNQGRSLIIVRIVAQWRTSKLGVHIRTLTQALNRSVATWIPRANFTTYHWYCSPVPTSYHRRVCSLSDTVFPAVCHNYNTKYHRCVSTRRPAVLIIDWLHVYVQFIRLHSFKFDHGGRWYVLPRWAALYLWFWLHYLLFWSCYLCTYPLP